MISVPIICGEAMVEMAKWSSAPTVILNGELTITPVVVETVFPVAVSV